MRDDVGSTRHHTDEVAMSDIPSFAKLVPGFDFLQDLAKNAGAALPSVGQWVAPTLDPEELHKRIEELKTVQFWLEQNARMLGTTIQALEVQRMTLSTLKTMNVQMADLRDAMKLAPSPAAQAQAQAQARPEPASRPADDAPAAGTPGVVDPMQWWGALTRQFTQLAATALQDSAAPAAASPAGAASKKPVQARPAKAAPAGESPARKTAARAAKPRAN